MIRALAICSMLFFSAACAGDESVANYGAAGKIWALTEVNQTPFPARATLEFGDKGTLSGHAPCNRFSTKQTAPYPWFKITPVLSTKMACTDLQSEALFFDMLTLMTLSEVSGDTLVLTNEAEQTMVFKAQ